VEYLFDEEEEEEEVKEPPAQVKTEIPEVGTESDTEFAEDDGDEDNYDPNAQEEKMSSDEVCLVERPHESINCWTKADFLIIVGSEPLSYTSIIT